MAIVQSPESPYRTESQNAIRHSAAARRSSPAQSEHNQSPPVSKNSPQQQSLPAASTNEIPRPPALPVRTRTKTQTCSTHRVDIASAHSPRPAASPPAPHQSPYSQRQPQLRVFRSLTIHPSCNLR